MYVLAKVKDDTAKNAEAFTEVNEKIVAAGINSRAFTMLPSVRALLLLEYMQCLRSNLDLVYLLRLFLLL